MHASAVPVQSSIIAVMAIMKYEERSAKYEMDVTSCDRLTLDKRKETYQWPRNESYVIAKPSNSR